MHLFFVFVLFFCFCFCFCFFLFLLKKDHLKCILVTSVHGQINHRVGPMHLSTVGHVRKLVHDVKM